MPAFPLPQSAAEAGYSVLGFDSIGSTNAEAMEAATRGDSGKVGMSHSSRPRGAGGGQGVEALMAILPPA